MKIRKSMAQTLRVFSPLWMLLFLFTSQQASALSLPKELKERLLGASTGSQGPAPELESGLAADNSIDPHQYLIGGGDGFSIAITELPSHDYGGIVNTSGNLFIPDFGEIKLGPITLDSAEKLIRRHVLGQLKRKYEVYVQLRKIKNPTVRVTGEISNPGTFSLPGTHNLIDVIKHANKEKLPESNKADLRNVRISIRDSTFTFDVLKSILGRDVSHPLYLYPGMTIEVPPLDRTLIVAGEIVGKGKGIIPYKDGETLASLCSLLTISAWADSQRIQVKNPGENLQLVSWENRDQVLLKANSLVTFVGKLASQSPDTVRITGEVRHEGTYFLETEALPQSLIEAAGGHLETASLKDAFIIRRSKLIYNQSDINNMDRIGNTVSPYPVVPGHQGARPQVPSSLNDLFVTGDFSLIRLDEVGKDFHLRSGDEIHVPKTDNWVYVSGHVGRPGPYPFHEGSNANDYVQAAGGRSRIGDGPNTYVMTYYQGILRIKTMDQVRAGDYVVVPASTEYKRLSVVYIPMIQATATVLSVLLSSIALYATLK
jgi:protein involved in polysaccharide export with SLBB domain